MGNAERTEPLTMIGPKGLERVDVYKRQVQYIIVNEAGASVYSASNLATEEFPQFDVGQRSAASMARRLQDPLAELVKIDQMCIRDRILN